jgi:hypothetical protein
MLAAPELVIAQRVKLLDQIEVTAELQHRMLADRMMRGQEGSEFQARRSTHGTFLGSYLLYWLLFLDSYFFGGRMRRNAPSRLR